MWVRGVRLRCGIMLVGGNGRAVCAVRSCYVRASLLFLACVRTGWGLGCGGGGALGVWMSCAAGSSPVCLGI